MLGIDHDKAPLAVREKFSLTKKQAAGCAARLRGLGAGGAVVLCTCNRMEFWYTGALRLTPQELLRQFFGVEAEEYERFFAFRSGCQAVEHLFALACGLKSQIFGEDQILTQVGQAAEAARSAGTTDSVLDRLFRDAVAAAKEVKSRLRLTHASRSAAASMAAFCREQLGDLTGLRALVIGSGEMGRLAAQELLAAGCRVCMTVRQYHQGLSVVPPGCQPVEYARRLEAAAAAQLVVSATASPHYTIRLEDAQRWLNPETLLLDLAVPRDIDPQIHGLGRYRLYDMESLSVLPDPGSIEAMDEANRILRQREEEFLRWYAFRPYVPAVQQISARVAKDLACRMEKALRGQPQLAQTAEDQSAKAVSHLLYRLRETLPPEHWQACFEALASAQEEENT